MKNIRDLLITLTISAIVLVAGICLLEKHYRNELDKTGWLPKDKLNIYPYGRKISGYTISENAPDYIINAYNDDFKPVSMKTDDNGFLTDGVVIPKEKDSSTIRIFIVGGSVAFGSIQYWDLMKDTYPSGTYGYNTSIAGKLKALLSAKFPSFKFEVINAGIPGHCINQNLALYFEKLHDFNPDIIVNIDGFNDMGNFVSGIRGGDPYTNTEELEDELELTTMARLPQRPYMLAYYNFKYVRKQAGLFNAHKISSKSISDDTTVIRHEIAYKSYEAIRPCLKISKKMLWLIDSYERQLHADGVFSIFCLQPTLQRRVYQKELSPLELKFRAVVEKITVADTINLDASLDPSSPLQGLFESIQKKIGSDSYWTEGMLHAYLFNDLSPVFDSIVESKEGQYVDANKEMTAIKSDKEFFVDNCHLTPFGNEFLAELILRKIELFMAQKQGAVIRGKTHK